MLAAVTQAVDSHDQIMLALIAAMTALVGLLGLVIRSKLVGIAADAADVNAAVNHKDTGELSLYRLAAASTDKLDQVIEKQADFDRKWGNLPPEMGDAVSLFGMLHQMDSKILDMQDALRRHIEMTEH